MPPYVEIAPMESPTPTGYAPGVKDRMTDEQRAHLTHLAEEAIRTQQIADAALAARDAFAVFLLEEQGIGATEIGRCIPGDTPEGHMHRTQVYRIRDNYARRQRQQG